MFAKKEKVHASVLDSLEKADSMLSLSAAFFLEDKDMKQGMGWTILKACRDFFKDSHEKYLKHIRLSFQTNGYADVLKRRIVKNKKVLSTDSFCVTPPEKSKVKHRKRGAK